MVNDSMDFFAIYRSKALTGKEHRSPAGHDSRGRSVMSRAVALLGRGLVTVGRRLERFGVSREQDSTMELTTHA